MLKRAKLQWCHIGYYIDDVTLFSLLHVCIYNAKTQVAEDCEQAINERMKAQHDISCDMGDDIPIIEALFISLCMKCHKEEPHFRYLGKVGTQ